MGEEHESDVQKVDLCENYESDDAPMTSMVIFDAGNGSYKF